MNLSNFNNRQCNTKDVMGCNPSKKNLTIFLKILVYDNREMVLCNDEL